MSTNESGIAPLPPNSEQLQMLMSGESGCGDVLRLCRESRNWQQSDLAQRLNVTRSAIAQWETGKRWPRGINLDKLLIALSPSYTVVHDKRLESRVTQQELTGLLHNLNLAGKTQIEQADAMLTYAYPRVLSTLILKATATPGLNVDTKAIALFFEHMKHVGEEKHRQALGQSRDVTPEQDKWSSGQGVYQAQESTTSSGSRNNTSEPEPNTDKGSIE